MMRLMNWSFYPLLLMLITSQTAWAGTLHYENITSLEIRDISLLSSPLEADTILRNQGFNNTELPERRMNSGKHVYERTDPLLHDIELFELSYDRGTIVALYYKKTYPQSQSADHWRNFLHAHEIDFALDLLCDAAAVDGRDCKSRKIYDSPRMTFFTIEARRFGNYQQKYLARFSAMYEGYSWLIKRANLNE